MRALGWTFVILVAAAFIGGGFYAKWRYDKFVGQLAQCRGQLDEHTAKLADAAAERDRETNARSETEKTVADTQANLTTTKAELEELRKSRAEAEERLAAFNAMTAKLQKMIDTGKLKVMIRKNRMIVKMPAEVLFASGKADLSPEGQATMAEVGAVLRQFIDRRFMVAGHTDNVPLGESKYSGNWELSTARAVTVTEFLIKNGLRPTNLIAAGYGEFDPVAPNASAQGRQENRRIELVLQPNLDELPKLLDKNKGTVAPAPASTNTPAVARP
jgi:chemotaxis protein MotB